MLLHKNFYLVPRKPYEFNEVVQKSMRNVLLDTKSHSEPLIPVLQSTSSTGAPDPARETLSVLFVVQATRRTPEHGFAKIQFNGDTRSGTRNVERVVCCPSNTASPRTRLYEDPSHWGHPIRYGKCWACCVFPSATALRRFNSRGARSRGDPFAQRHPVRAQGIEGVRSSHAAEGRHIPERRGRSARARSPAKPGFLRYSAKNAPKKR
jgi:hypothetical protein